MDVSRAIVGGVLQLLMPLQSLVHVPGLRYVKRNPLPLFGLFGIDVIAWHGRERSFKGIDRVLILLSRLARPTDRIQSRALRLLAATCGILFLWSRRDRFASRARAQVLCLRTLWIKDASKGSA